MNNQNIQNTTTSEPFTAQQYAACAVCERHESHPSWPWCAYCGPSILRHWGFAAGGGAALAGALYATGQVSPLVATAFSGFFAVLAVLSLIDARSMLLPDKLTLPLIWAGLLFNLLLGFTPLSFAVLGAMGGYLSLYALNWLSVLTSGRDGVGGGDFKLLAAIGAWLGYMPLKEVLLVASVGALAYVGYLKLKGKGGFLTPFPFGPFIAMGGVVAVFLQLLP